MPNAGYRTVGREDAAWHSVDVRFYCSVEVTKLREKMTPVTCGVDRKHIRCIDASFAPALAMM